VCELLGLDALNFANEGKLVIVVAREATEAALAQLQSHPLAAAPRLSATWSSVPGCVRSACTA
jgi:hydrogenase maturation factor